MTPRSVPNILAVAAGLATAATASAQFVPTYRAPTSPGIENYRAPTSPGVASYYAPTSPGIASYYAPVQPGVASYVAPVSPSVAVYAGAPRSSQQYYWHQPSPGSSWTTVSSSSLSSQHPSALLGNLFGPDTAAPVRPANDIHVVLPNPEAKVSLNGNEMTGTGRSRHLAMEGVTNGSKNEYTVSATWMMEGKPVTRTQTVHLDGSGHALVDFRQE